MQKPAVLMTDAELDALVLDTSMPAPSPEEVLLSRTPKSIAAGNEAWSAKTLASWGVPWPPPRGWRIVLRARWEQENYVGAEDSCQPDR